MQTRLCSLGGCLQCQINCLQDLDLLSVEDGAIVDRNAALFCHVAIYRNGVFVIEQVSALPMASHAMFCRPAD